MPLHEMCYLRRRIAEQFTNFTEFILETSYYDNISADSASSEDVTMFLLKQTHIISNWIIQLDHFSLFPILQMLFVGLAVTSKPSSRLD